MTVRVKYGGDGVVAKGCRYSTPPWFVLAMRVEKGGDGVEA